MTHEAERDALEVIYRAGDALRTALMHRDEYTQAHCDRVSRLAVRIGERCGLGEAELAPLRLAAVFHDIGKIGIPDRVLFKRGPLGAEEFAIMQAHATIGASIVEKIDLPHAAEAARIIRWHHEHMDGTGYPDGIAGEAVPVASRIIAVVDAFDALTSRRCYRAPMTATEALALMGEGAGGRFDPYVFAKLVPSL
jgi:putative nucleotidyltransferase with HDIG domain